MHQVEMRGSKKSLSKLAICLVLFAGLFLNNASVNGEEVTSFDEYAEYNVIPFEADECAETICEDIEMSYDLEEEQQIFPDQETNRPEITWNKNAATLGNFEPDQLYVFEDFGNDFSLSEKQTFTDNDGEINLMAVVLDENENDYYTFRMTYADDGQNWEAQFENFVTNFQK